MTKTWQLTIVYHLPSIGFHPFSSAEFTRCSRREADRKVKRALTGAPNGSYAILREARKPKPQTFMWGDEAGTFIKKMKAQDAKPSPAWEAIKALSPAQFNQYLENLLCPQDDPPDGKDADAWGYI